MSKTQGEENLRALYREGCRDGRNSAYKAVIGIAGIVLMPILAVIYYYFRAKG